MDPAYKLRPVRESDIGALTELVNQIKGGMTSLPDHPDYLANRIDDSLRAFDKRIRKPAGEVYLFVLEDLAKKTIIGTSGILSRVGGFDPFYTYKIINHLQEYEPLNIHKSIQTLELVKNHKGPTEMCSLFLHPDYRKHGIGKLLSLSRFCFIKAFPERFDDNIIAELRGFIDEEGRSPFWEAVGKNFFCSDYYSADVLSGIGEKEFIEALMPAHPIYISLLPQSAREVIGQVHTHTAPAKKILLREGFKETDEVDIFDAGPILQAKREDLVTWEATKEAEVQVSSSKLTGTKQTLVTNNSLNFKVTLCPAKPDEGNQLIISPETAKTLAVESGDKIQYLVY